MINFLLRIFTKKISITKLYSFSEEDVTFLTINNLSVLENISDFDESITSTSFGDYLIDEKHLDIKTIKSLHEYGYSSNRGYSINILGSSHKIDNISGNYSAYYRTERILTHDVWTALRLFLSMRK